MKDKDIEKQEQIEEIKSVLIKTCKRCRTFQEDYMQDAYAEAIYGAGYRKAEKALKVAEKGAEMGISELEQYEEEQIAKMAVIGCARTPQAKTSKECKTCDFNGGYCHAYRHARLLYYAGYRKIPTETVVLSKQERTFRDYACYDTGYATGKSEAAKEILQAWYNDVVHGMGEDGGYIKEYAKKYGVEVKE